MAKKIKEVKTNTVDKKLLVALTEKIREERYSKLGEVKKEGSLFTTTTKFTSKYISKYQYRQLLGLYKFMMDNPKLTEDDIRKVIYKKPIEFGFLNKCVRDIDGFILNLKKQGVDSIAEDISRQKGTLEY